MPISDYGFDLPPDIVEEARKLKAREAIAQQLLQQSGQPLHTPKLGRLASSISPLEGIAQMVQAYAGNKRLDEANKGYAELGSKYQQKVADEMAKVQAMASGTPGRPAEVLPEDVMGPPAPEVAAVAPNPRAAVETALMSKFPQMQKFGTIQLNELNRREDKKTAAEDKVFQLQLAAKTKMDAIELQAREGRISRQEADARAAELRRELAANSDALRRELAEGRNQNALALRSMAGALQRPVVATIQSPDDPNSTQVVDASTGRVIGKGPKLSATGAAEQKLSLGLPQARVRVESISQNLDRLDTAMTELDKDPGLTNITGTVMGRTPNITNKATGAQAKLNSIKSQIFQSSLQAMREASKTGGAVGNVSDREGDKLERTLAALDQAQGTPDFKIQLKNAIKQVRTSKEIIRNAFEEQYGGVQSRNPPSGGSSGGWTDVQ